MLTAQDTAPAMTAAQFGKLSQIVHSDTGIVLSEAKRGLLVARLSKRLRALNMADFGAYCTLLDSDRGKEERRHLLSAITTNVTAFFREGHHFDALARDVLPQLIARAKAGGRVRLWSAACSSGEEAYSMAMTVLDAFPDAAQHDVLILATDIDPEVVARAESGVYPTDTIAAIGGQRLRKYFDQQGDSFTAKPALKAIMRFGELNLHQPWPFSGTFDVIFCRNVVIYFDTDMRRSLWQRFATVLSSDGALFIGHSERVDGPAAQQFRITGATQYQLVTPTSPSH
ncbi:chemotaxis protein methyltransferase CheR [Ketogulonicigenium robustum]|uniref:Chemotaxis protein methyltransferase n=1 Tax=Ketogulonicigenium robustum TaxID=92947 RepID=A0A1W6P007_9RHOB|nr:protein-glutamate O-methyltransferase [Ketogulonicigenium robustum]ARO14846.1 chemotaxis protein methyltransferase CheR [Ketogulonicigenium robustum]